MSYLASIPGWWNDGSLVSQLFWDLGYIGLFLIIAQGVLVLVFGHHDSSAGDGHEFGWSNFLTLKSFAAMFLGIGFGSVVFGQLGLSLPFAVAGGAGIGFLLALFFIFLMRLLHGLRSDGTARLSQAIGQRATVYLPIAGEETAHGEIQVAFAGRLVNVPAFTRGPALPTGTDVLVTALHGEHALEVEKVTIDQPKIN